MIVQFDMPGPNGWNRTVDLPDVPRVGEFVHEPDYITYVVHAVAWYPWGVEDDGQPSAYVVLRSV